MKENINIVYNPIYELITSLILYSDKTLLKNSEMKNDAGIKAKKSLNPEMQKMLQNKELKKELSDIMELMVIFHEQDFKTIADFSSWFKKMSISDLANYASLTPSLLQDLIPRLESLEATGELLSAWDKQYFSHLSDDIKELLHSDAEEKKEMSKTMDAQHLVEKVTNGVWLDDINSNTSIYLVPQYHIRPLNIYTRRENLFIAHYPVDTVSEPEEPSPRLKRLTSALCDSKRLKILRYLAREERTFMEVVSYLDVSKSTVHYHMAALRAAGLIRVKMTNNESIIYSLRHNTLDEVSLLLKEFIEQGNTTTHINN